MAKRQRVIDRDRGWAKYRRHMESAKGAYVKVGVIAELGIKPKQERGVAGVVKNSEDKSVVDVAFWNEFGTKRIPSRSFIRSTHDEQRQRLRSVKRKLGRQIANGMPVDVALGVLGEWMKTKQIQKIDRLRTPPNKPATIKRKGSSNPLVDIGQMKQSIHYQISIPRGMRLRVRGV
jgi:hypothetical protein